MQDNYKIEEVLNNYEVIICDESYKRKVLEFMHKEKIISHVIFKDFSTFTQEILGSYTNEAIFDLGKSENYDYDLAKNKLFYTHFINEDSYKNNKVKELSIIKEKYKKYLTPSNIEYYSKRKIAFVDIDETNELLVLAINKLKKFYNKELTFIDTFKNNNECIYVEEFFNIKQEVSYLVNNICEKLKSGISCEKIKINNPSSNYYSIIKEMFNLANIDISLSKSPKLIEYNYIKSFLSILYTKKESEVFLAFKETLEEVSLEETINNVKAKLVEILNEIIFTITSDSIFKVKDIYEYLVYRLKNTSINKTKYENVIEFVDAFNERLDANDIVYFIGFNQDVIPKTYKDDAYLNDYEREEIGMYTSLKQNILEKTKVLKIIENFNTIYISYSLTSMEGNLVKSSFLSELDRKCKVVRDTYHENIYHTYSLPILHLSYAKERDLYEKYNTVSEKLKAYTLVFKNEKRYDSKFKDIDIKKYKEFLKPGLNLSYTSIDSFYECPFRFYLERVLKLNKTTNEEAIQIGNLFHYCFCEILKREKVDDISKELDNLIKAFYEQEKIDIKNDKKKMVYISIYKDILTRNYLFIQKQMENTKFKLKSLEKEYKIVLDRGCNIVLRGKIDKVLTLHMRGHEYGIVVDYKTGSSDFSFDNVIYGLDMQLLFYFMFLNSSSDVSFGGAYLASVLPNLPFIYDANKTYDMQMEEYFLLNGYSNEDMFILSQIDSKVGTDSSYLKGIKLKNDGTLNKTSYKKVLTEEEFAQILNIAKDKINEAIDDIVKAKFSISPKKIGKELTCSYCSYKDICYVSDEQVIELEKKKDLSFIRGESDE